MAGSASDRWSDGAAYEAFIGRWSRLVAAEFLHWLEVPPLRRWLDVGCGTGVLTGTILSRCQPDAVMGVDPSEAFIAHARATIADPRATFAVGNAAQTHLGDQQVDAVISGLVLNFVPDLVAAVSESRRVSMQGGVVAGYVWDYADGMQLLRRFWDAAVALDPAAQEHDEGVRFPEAGAEPLAVAFSAAGLDGIETRAIDVPTIFSDFDDLWTPFLSGTGPAPAYVASLKPQARDELRERLRASVPPEPDGSIHLIARAWAAKGRVGA